MAKVPDNMKIEKGTNGAFANIFINFSKEDIYKMIKEVLCKINADLKKNNADCADCALFSECKGAMQKGTKCFRNNEGKGTEEK